MPLLSTRLKITAEKLGWMNEAEVEALSVACPACFTQFDTGQLQLSRKNRDRRMIPVFHIAELVAYALGADPEAIHLKSHKVETELLQASPIVQP
jgi:heterodisulfide reductase subunit B